MASAPLQPWTFNLPDVLQARRRIAGRVRRTPLARSAWLSRTSGADVWLKLESLQVTSSFKARGAVNFVRRLVEDEAARRAPRADLPPIVTASAGNHGQALAYAASQEGIRPTIFTARDAPVTKLDAIRSYGADLRDVANSYDESELLAKDFARATRGTYLSPYSHPDILAGTGTIALEILEDAPDVECVLVPLGGGGILAGMAATLARVAPRVEVAGVEAAASPAFSTSLREGRLTTIDVKPTIADGLAGNVDPDTLTFDLIRDHVSRIAQVLESDLEDAVAGLIAHEHLVTEGAGAAAAAALLMPSPDLPGRRVVAVVTGANIDAARLLNVLTRAAVRARAR